MALVKRGNVDICKRYRPHRMSEIVGNKSVKNVVEKVIEDKRRSHCFLLHGQPGSGKTTLARILSLGLNCVKGDTTEPCLECDNCLSGLNGVAAHITEVNVAHFSTKSSLEDSIINNFYLSSFTGRNNIFIFDEAHMMSNSAQNMMLKPFEEPPENTYIFLCTTEPNKIKPAIKQRCLQLEFKTPNVSDVSELLNDVVRQEDGWAEKLQSYGETAIPEFQEYVKGMSFREVLKSLEVFYAGGIDALTSKLEDSPENQKIPNLILYGTFDEIMKVTNYLASENKLNSESVRLGILSYMKTVLINKAKGFKSQNDVNSKNMVDAVKIKMVMDIFDKPYFDNEREPKPSLVKNLFQAVFLMKTNSTI